MTNDLESLSGISMSGYLEDSNNNELKIKKALNLSAKETSQIESYTAKLFASERPAEATEATRKNWLRLGDDWQKLYKIS